MEKTVIELCETDKDEIFRITEKIEGCKMMCVHLSSELRTLDTKYKTLVNTIVDNELAEQKNTPKYINVNAEKSTITVSEIKESEQ